MGASDNLCKAARLTWSYKHFRRYESGTANKEEWSDRMGGGGRADRVARHDFDGDIFAFVMLHVRSGEANYFPALLSGKRTLRQVHQVRAGRAARNSQSNGGFTKRSFNWRFAK